MAPTSGPPAQAGMAVVLLLLGFSISTALVQERVRERELPKRAEALRTLAASRQQEIDRLTRRAAELSAALEDVEERASSGSAELRDLLARVDALRAPAGVAPLRGPGLTVTLTDSPKAPATRAESADLVVHDADLQLVVNELWRSGAEAIAVNGRRVVATTAIRSAGGRILVNYSAVASPYRVVALGDGAAMSRSLSSSEIGRRFQVWTQVYGLGFETSTSSDLRVPALPAPEVRSARPEDA